MMSENQNSIRVLPTSSHRRPLAKRTNAHVKKGSKKVVKKSSNGSSSSRLVAPTPFRQQSKSQQTPRNPSSLRRSLRESLRPTTPRSLLTRELEDTSNTEESFCLLASPIAPRGGHSRETAGLVSSRVKPENIPRGGESNKASIQEKTIVANKPRNEIPTDKKKSLLPALKTYALKDSPVPNGTADASSSSTSTIKTHAVAVTVQQKQKPPAETPQLRFKPTPQVAKSAIALNAALVPETKTPWKASTDSASSSSKGGLCLDLTDMFCQAKTPRPKTPKLLISNKISSDEKNNKKKAKPQETTTITSSNVLSNHNNPHNDNWAEQQSSTFVHFLNHTFASHDPLERHQQAAAARRRAQQLWKDLQPLRHVLEKEIRQGKLRVRADRDLKSDVWVQGQLLQILGQFQTTWLQLGLEVCMGQYLPMEEGDGNEDNGSFAKKVVAKKGSPSGKTGKKVRGYTRLRTFFDSFSVLARFLIQYLFVFFKVPPMKATLKNCILQRILSDDKVLEKYTGGKCNLPSGSFEAKYRAELGRLSLYRLLSLCFFLDQAKKANILDAPLFWPTASLKSSRHILLALSRDILQAEGDFVKHLSRMGLSASYEQEAVDEVDCVITNLAIDLRDGTRLARLAEIWTGLPRHALLRKLRLPAVSRLQKLHNVRLVLDKLGHPPSVAAHHIVDGHCGRVLQWLWWVVAEHCLDDLLPAAQVRAEVMRLERIRPTGIVVSSSDDLQILLGQWASAVSRRYGRDLTEWDSLTDGSVVCLIVHYYHPKLLPMQLLRKQKCNPAHLANQRLLQLGGIPPLQEGSLLLFMACLCSRLLVASAQLGAARRVQSAWRNYYETRRRRSAVKTLARVWRQRRATYFEKQRIKYKGAVIVLETFVKQYQPALHRLRAQRMARSKAIVTLQVCCDEMFHMWRSSDRYLIRLSLFLRN